jgi:hypothetical protein
MCDFDWRIAMWVLIYLLIILLPIGLIGLVIFVTAGAGMNIYRTGKRGYADLKPYIDSMNAKVKLAQEKTIKFAERGDNLAKSFEEINGRWAFIAEGFTETKKSPAVMLAGMAGKMRSKK